MDEFSAYFVNSAGIITGVKSISSETSQEAMVRAKRLLTETMCLEIELWDRCSIVGIVDRE